LRPVCSNMAKDCPLILIVDDEEIDSVVMRRALEHSGGFTVVEARSYEAAVELFAKKKDEIDLAVIDVSLPGRSGIDLGRSFLRQRLDLKLLFVSGWVGAELLRTHQMAESDQHFLAKPFRPAELVARVRSLLEGTAGNEWLDDASSSEPDTTNGF
jgi:two-component system, cell cycle sensor histidine kinase and response regulator CckA